MEERRCGFEVGGGAGDGLPAHIGLYVTGEGCEEGEGEVTGEPCQVLHHHIHNQN